MGNQNKTSHNMNIVQEQDQRLIIDLDEIVEQWIWYTWNTTKSLSRFKREDLLITIDWKHVSFTQDKVHFSNSLSSYLPRTIFRTNFDNKTTTEQLYNFIADRSTCSILEVRFTHTLHKLHESTIAFHLPKQLSQFHHGIQHEQCIPFGRDTTKEYTIPWNVNSPIRVPSRSRLSANLNIAEEEISNHFSVPIQFSGRIMAMITTRRAPNSCLKLIVGDIGEIICKAMKTNHRLNAFEIIGGNPVTVGFVMRGKYSFRYGVKQHIILNQESLDLSSSSCSDLDITPSAPSEYCHMISSDMKNNNLSPIGVKDNGRL